MKLGCTTNQLSPAAGAAPIVGDIERAAHFGLESIMAIFLFLDPKVLTQAFYDSVAEASQRIRHAAKYNTGVILCSMIVAPADGSRPLTAFPWRDRERDLAPPPHPLP